MRKLNASGKRIVVYFAILLAVLAWDIRRRWWTPSVFVDTAHFSIQSSATEWQTEETAIALEILREGYARALADLGRTVVKHERLRVKLFRDRDEFRFCNRVRGWEEGFYRGRCSYQYYSTEMVNVYHSAMHESVHQLNKEGANLSVPQWLEEGLACYLSASRIVTNRLSLGDIDTNTYPVWWLDQFGRSGDLETDKVDGSVIPLKVILAGKGGPDMDEAFNLYYLHWWSLVHFLLHAEQGRHRCLVARSLTGKEDGEAVAGEIAALEMSWYAHTLALKKSVAGRATPAPVLGTKSRR